MTNGPSGTLYIGVTSDIGRRAWEHREGIGSAFCKKWKLTRLVHVEHFKTIEAARMRERAMKAWRRSWKLNLIGRNNSDWVDLYDTLNQ